MQVALRSSWLVASLTVTSVAAGCAADGGPPPGTGALRIAVAPLSLPDVTDVCYALAVTGPDGLVWEQRHICAGRYGNARGGDIAYVGTCDASGGTALAPTMNTVTLAIENLYDVDHPMTGGDPSVAGATAWRNPCRDDAGTPELEGCEIDAPCRENADTPVDFDLTIMRQANQGFFDVAVNFEDIFCSAKVDCPPTLLSDPVSGARGDTAVLAFACTAGATGETTLLMDDVVIACPSGERYTVQPIGQPGNHGGQGAGLYQTALYTGVEQLGGYDKCYWNIGLGLDLETAADPGRLGKGCHLTTRATALADAAPGTFATPGDTAYPIVTIDVPLTGAPGSACQPNGLDADGSGVRSDYTDVAERTGETFQNRMRCGEEPVAAAPDECAGHATHITGPIEISDITGYHIARCVETADGGLTIIGLADTESLSFPRLRSAAALQVQALSGMSSVSFPVLTTVSGGVAIFSNHSVTSFELPQLTSVGDLTLQELYDTTALAFPSLVSAASLHVRSNPVLGAIAFPALAQLGPSDAGTLEVRQNPLLPDCAALDLAAQLTGLGWNAAGTATFTHDGNAACAP
ncbi:MAG: hypothetical protein U1F43_15780 [Myxococcota bacterium]